MPSDPQHYEDRVVFEPSDLDAHLRMEGEAHRPCFEVVAIIEPGGYRSFLLRGFDPGRDRFEQLRERVSERGWGFERITREGRSADDPRSDPAAASESAPSAVAEMVPTVAVLIAIPSAADPSELRQLLCTATADWELPLLSPALDEAAEELEAAERASAMLERWQP